MELNELLQVMRYAWLMVSPQMLPDARTDPDPSLNTARGWLIFGDVRG